MTPKKTALPPPHRPRGGCWKNVPTKDGGETVCPSPPVTRGIFTNALEIRFEAEACADHTEGLSDLREVKSAGRKEAEQLGRDQADKKIWRGEKPKS